MKIKDTGFVFSLLAISILLVFVVFQWQILNGRQSEVLVAGASGRAPDLIGVCGDGQGKSGTLSCGYSYNWQPFRGGGEQDCAGSVGVVADESGRRVGEARDMSFGGFVKWAESVCKL